MPLGSHSCQEIRAHYIFDDFIDPIGMKLLFVILVKRDCVVHDCLYEAHIRRVTTHNPVHFVCELTDRKILCLADQKLAFCNNGMSMYVF